MSYKPEMPDIPAGKVPFAMEQGNRVPKERYYDRAFFELEKEKLWYRTWQMACRLQEIPEPNDFIEYEICDQSVLVIRQPDGSIKAFNNVCPHRATQIEKGAGVARGGQLTCPFHGWRWNTDGSPSFIYGKEGFAPECVTNAELRLREVKCDTWGDSVWINLDPEAGPLREALHPAAELLEGMGIHNWRVKWWQEAILNANWKMAQEAFMEGWHVMRTHPQLTLGYGEATPPDTLAYNVYPNGHSNFQSKIEHDFPSFDVMLASSQLLAEGLDAMAIDRDIKILEGVRHKIKPGESIRQVVAREMKAYNDGAGIPTPEGFAANPLWWNGEVFLFPNIFYLPMYGNSLAYRIRPYGDDPERCRFEVWSLTTYPETYPYTRATLDGRYERDDGKQWPLIPIQDFSNIERQQKGLHSLAFDGLRLATEWESAITNMHFELDRRLARD